MLSTPNTTALNFIIGADTNLPCCLVHGDTLELAEPRQNETCVFLGGSRREELAAMSRAIRAKGVVHCVEMSKDVLRDTRAWLNRRGRTNIEYLHSLFEDIEILDASVDLVVSDCSLALVQDKRRVMEEVYRILKPKGRFVFNDVVIDFPISRHESTSGASMCQPELITKEAYFDIIEAVGFGGITIIEESVPRQIGAGAGLRSLTSLVIVGNRPCRDSGPFWSPD